MLLHAEKHRTKDQFKCDVCPHKTNSKYNLQQHVQGAYGDEWPAHCGKTFNWPSRKNRHQQKCEECKDVLKKKRDNESKFAADMMA